MSCPAASYIARAPENLVVNGYRYWMKGCAAGDARQWRSALALHTNRLGAADGGLVMDSLVSFMGALGRCARCPVAFLPPDCGHLCRDECLVLALIAAVQHGDERAGHVCAEALTCQRRSAQLYAGAGDYAMRLKINRQILLPIPASVAAGIAQARPAAPAGQISTAIH